MSKTIKQKYLRRTNRRIKKAGTRAEKRETTLTLKTNERDIPLELRRLILLYDRHNERYLAATNIALAWRKSRNVKTNIMFLLRRFIQLIKDNVLTKRQKEYIKDYLIDEVIPQLDDFSDDGPYWYLPITEQGKAQVEEVFDDIKENADIDDRDNLEEEATKRIQKRWRRTRQRKISQRNKSQRRVKPRAKPRKEASVGRSSSARNRSRRRIRPRAKPRKKASVGRSSSK